MATDAFRLPKLSKRSMITRAIQEHDATSGLNVEDLFADSSTEVNEKRLTVEPGGIPLPSWLNGALIRNGPGVFGAEKRRFAHIFDGLAKLTRFDFNGDGSIHFSARFIRSSLYQTMIDKGDISPGPYTGPVIPSFNRKQKIQGLVNSMSSFDNVPVNVHQLGDDKGPWVGTTDAPVQVQFDPITLQTIGKVKSKGRRQPHRTISEPYSESIQT